MLGKGGMGTVWLATVEGAVPGLPPGEEVAVKVVHPQLAADPDAFERFVHEAALGRRVRHENVVRTLDAGIEIDPDSASGERVYLVMEHVVGRTLAELRGSPQSEGFCRRIARDVARALGGIHALGVVHGDLKPENVLLTADEVVKVMDLGLARFRDRTLRQSQAGSFAGSLLYAAPEQFAGDERVSDARADLYALGVTLWELAAGAHPFAADDPRVVMHRHATVPAPALRDARSDISPFFSAVVAALLEKEPGRRFRTADELSHVLVRGEQSPWWRNRAARQAASRRPPVLARAAETALHGREHELAALLEAWRDAARGRTRAVVLRGDPGSGKTRLVQALLDLGESDGSVIRAEGAPPDAPVPGPTVALCEDLDAPGGDGDRDRAAFLAAAARRDLGAVLLVGTLRSPPPRRWRDAVREAAQDLVEIELSPVRGEALAELAAETFDSGRPSESVIARLGALSAGNPGIALLLLAHWRDVSAIRLSASGEWVFADTREGGDEASPWPEAAERLLAARVAALGDDDREHVEIAALLHPAVHPAIFGAVTGLDPRAAAGRLLDLAARTGLLEERAAARGGVATFAFRSPGAARSLANALPDFLRPEYHRAAALAWADAGSSVGAGHPEEIARHALAADLPELAAERILPALDRLLAARRPDDAEVLARSALASPGLAAAAGAGAPGRETEIRVRLARALLRTGRPTAADACLAAPRSGGPVG